MNRARWISSLLAIITLLIAAGPEASSAGAPVAHVKPLDTRPPICYYQLEPPPWLGPEMLRRSGIKMYICPPDGWIGPWNGWDPWPVKPVLVPIEPPAKPPG